MAGVRFAAVTAEVSTGTSVKTIVQVVAASNHRILIDRATVTFQGTSTTDAPILVEMLRQSTAGTMSSLTPVKLNSADDETLQVTARHTAPAEPTAGDVLESFLVHPQGGKEWLAPFGRAIVVPGGGRLGVRVTAGVSVDCVVSLHGEE